MGWNHVKIIFALAYSDPNPSMYNSCVLSPLKYSAVLISYVKFTFFPLKYVGRWLNFYRLQSHYSIKKAAHWLGFGTDSVIIINTNEHGQMVTEELEAAIKMEIEGGRHPLMVNATAGTTVLGAIDELNAIADLCQKFGIWMHVDVSILYGILNYLLSAAVAQNFVFFIWHEKKIIIDHFYNSSIKEMYILLVCNTIKINCELMVSNLSERVLSISRRVIDSSHSNFLCLNKLPVASKWCRFDSHTGLRITIVRSKSNCSGFVCYSVFVNYGYKLLHAWHWWNCLHRQMAFQKYQWWPMMDCWSVIKSNYLLF